jgi:hypothetical protein
MIRSGHAAHIAERIGACRVLVVKPEGKGLLGSGRMLLKWNLNNLEGHGLD